MITNPMSATKKTACPRIPGLSALVAIFILLIIGGCGGGTMGTQTGEQRVTVMGAALNSNGTPVAGVAVELIDSDGNSLGNATTSGDGTYVAQVVAPTADINVLFITLNGKSASAVVTVTNVTSVTVNLLVPPTGPPVVVVPTPTPSPTSTAGQPIVTPTPAAPFPNTPTPAPPPGATSTPVPTKTPPPVPTAPIDTPPPDDGSVCEVDSQADSDPPPTVCCTYEQALAGECCNDYWRSKGAC